MASDKYVQFFLNSKSTVVQYECIELSHPSFSKPYYVVRNNTAGLTAKLETGETVFFEYYPLEVSQTDSENNLDYSMKLQFGDLGEVLPLELDRVNESNGFAIRPMFKYRTYRSDDLNQPMFGPQTLEIVNFAFNKNGAMFEANAPRLSIHKTGEVYSIARFPMLRGFL